MDEYLEGIRNREPRAEQAPKPEWLASYSGFTVHRNPNLSNGWIELRNDKDEVIACIDNVKSIHLATSRRP